MKTIFKWILGLIGFVIGIFGFFACSLIGSDVHVLQHWSFIGWMGALLPILTPYSFSLVISHEKGSLEHVKNILTLGICLDILLIMSARIELKHMVGFSDVIWGVSFWSVWQIAAVLAYFLKVRSTS